MRVEKWTNKKVTDGEGVCVRLAMYRTILMRSLNPTIGRTVDLETNRREALKSKYPWIQCGLVSFGDGWLTIVEDLFSEIDKVVKRDRLEYFEVSDVKEKYGTLQVYHNDTEEIDRLCDEAETLSEHTCDNCGASGSMRKDAGWYRVECDICRAKRLKLNWHIPENPGSN